MSRLDEIKARADAATVARVEALAGQQAITCHATNRWDDERGWLDVLAIIERTALSGSETDTSDTQPTEQEAK